MSWLHQLQNKPRSKRRKIALFSAFTVTGVIFLAWFVYLSPFSIVDREDDGSGGLFNTLISYFSGEGGFSSVFDDGFSENREGSGESSQDQAGVGSDTGLENTQNPTSSPAVSLENSTSSTSSLDQNNQETGLDEETDGAVSESEGLE